MIRSRDSSPAAQNDIRIEMAKTFKNLYPQIYAFENLERAFLKARRGKRHKPNVASFEFEG